MSSSFPVNQNEWKALPTTVGSFQFSPGSSSVVNYCRVFIAVSLEGTVGYLVNMYFMKLVVQYYVQVPVLKDPGQMAGSVKQLHSSLGRCTSRWQSYRPFVWQQEETC